MTKARALIEKYIAEKERKKKKKEVSDKSSMASNAPDTSSQMKRLSGKK